MRFTVHNLIWLLRHEEGFRLRNRPGFRTLRFFCREAGQAENPDQQRGECCPGNQEYRANLREDQRKDVKVPASKETFPSSCLYPNCSVFPWLLAIIWSRAVKNSMT